MVVVGMGFTKKFVDDLLLKEALLSRTDLEALDVSPCIADNSRNKFIGKINFDVKRILPVLFLSTLNSKLTKNPLILSFTVKQHNFMIGENGDLAVTFVKDEEEMEYILNKLVELLNKGIKYNLSNKVNIDTMVEKKKKLTPMSLYELFPKTNCKECGEETCFNYVAKIMSGEKSHEKCPYVESRLIKNKITPIDLKWSIF